MLMATKLGRVVTHPGGLPPIKLHDLLITWSCKTTWQTKNVTTKVLITTKRGRMVTYFEWLLPITLVNPLVTWSSNIRLSHP